MKQAKVTIQGDRLLMHNVRLADPLDPYSKAIKAVAGKRKKSDDDHAEIARVEFEGGLYIDDAIGPYVPDKWLVGSIIGGARKRKLGREFAANVSLSEEKIKLIYDGPRTAAKLWEAGSTFVDRRGVGVNGKMVMRTRPIFRNWSATFTVQVLECDLNLSDLEEALDEAGPRGIGDGRPQLGGKFAVQSFKEVKS